MSDNTNEMSKDMLKAVVADTVHVGSQNLVIDSGIINYSADGNAYVSAHLEDNSAAPEANPADPAQKPQADATQNAPAASATMKAAQMERLTKAVKDIFGPLRDMKSPEKIMHFVNGLNPHQRKKLNTRLKLLEKDEAAQKNGLKPQAQAGARQNGAALFSFGRHYGAMKLQAVTQLGLVIDPNRHNVAASYLENSAKIGKDAGADALEGSNQDAFNKKNVSTLGPEVSHRKKKDLQNNLNLGLHSGPKFGLTS